MHVLLGIPAHVPEELVSSLEELGRPEVAERMTTLTAQGTMPGTGLTMRPEKLIEAYGLSLIHI